MQRKKKPKGMRFVEPARPVPQPMKFRQADCSASAPRLNLTQCPAILPLITFTAFTPSRMLWFEAILYGSKAAEVGFPNLCYQDRFERKN